MDLSSSQPEQGVVNILSPVKIAFAPAMNAYRSARPYYWG
jgi:hypothetical protein